MAVTLSRASLNAAMAAAADVMGESGACYLADIKTGERIGTGTWVFKPGTGFAFECVAQNASRDAKVVLQGKTGEDCMGGDIGPVGAGDKAFNVVTISDC